MSDPELVQKIVTKYPTYKDNIASYAPTQFEKERPGPQHVAQPNEGYAAGVKASLGTPPTLTDTLKDPSTYLGPGVDVVKNLVNAAKNAPGNYKAGGVAGVAAPLVGINPQSMAARAEVGDTAGILGEATIPTALAAAPAVGAGISRVAKPVMTALKPQLLNAADALIHPVQIPGKIAKFAVERIPDKPTFPGAPLPDAGEFYERKGEDLQRRGAQQGVLDAKAAREKALGDRAREKEGQAVPVTQSPYWTQNQAKLAVEAEDRKPVPVSQSPYFNQNKEKLAAAANAEKAAAEADVEARKPVPVTQSPYYNQNRIKTVAQAKEARDAVINKQIVTPDNSGAPRFVGSEGRAATWTNDRVMELAKQGNREAIQQAVRRGMELPPNARYVAGDPAFSSGVYNPRDVTVFGPDGTPVRQGGKVSPVAQPFTGRPEQKLSPELSATTTENPPTPTAPPVIGMKGKCGGINTQGAVASQAKMTPDAMAFELERQIASETGRLRTATASAEEKAQLAHQIETWKQQLDDIRRKSSKPAVPLHAANPKAPYLNREQ